MASHDGSIRIRTLLDNSLYEKGLNKLAASARKIGTLVAGALSIAALVTFGKECIELGSTLNEVQNVVDTSFAEMSYKIEEFSDSAIENFGLSEITAKQMGSTFASMGRGMGQSLGTATDAAVELTGRLGDVMSFYNLTAERAKTLGKAIYTGETEPLKEIGIVMTEAQLNTFALERGYKKLYKEMSAAEKLEIRQAFFIEKTSLAAGDFVKTQDSWANQTKILSERWKAFMTIVGDSLTTILSPALKMLNAAVSYMTDIAKQMNSVVNILFNVQPDTKPVAAATESVEEYGDSIEEAEKKAKKAVSGLDELNVISSDNTTDTPSGNSQNELLKDESMTLYPEKVEVDTQPIIENIADSIMNGDWIGIANAISEKIGEALDSINWDGIKESAKEVAVGVSDAINGFFGTDMFSSLGTTVGEGINTVVETADTFLKNVDFSSLGSSFASGAQSAFETIDFGEIFSAISTGFSGILDFIAGILDGIDWYQLPYTIIEKIIEAWNGIDFVSVFSSLGNLAGSLLLATWDLLSALVEIIGDAATVILNYFVENIKAAGWDTDNSLLENGAAIILGILNGIVYALAGIGEWIYENMINPFWSAITEKVSENPLLSAGLDIVAGLLDGIINGFSDIGEWVKENIFDPFVDAFKEKFGIDSKTSVMTDLGVCLMEDLRDGMKNMISKVVGVFKTIKTKVNDKMGEIKDSIDSVLLTIRRKWNSGWTAVKNTTKTIFSGIWTAIKDAINSILGGIESMANGVVRGVNKVIGALNRLSFDIPDWIPEIGGKTFGFNITELSEVSIPRLANGGIATASTIANIGEAGREAILPLENNTGWMDELAYKLGSKIRTNVVFDVNGDPNGIFNVVRRQDDVFFAKTGHSAFDRGYVYGV